MGATDIILIAAILFAFAFSSVIAYMVATQLESAPFIGSYVTPLKGWITTLDSLAIILVVGLAIGAIVLAFLIPSHPAFFIVSFIMMLVAEVLAVVFSNAYMTFAQTSTVSTAASNFPFLLTLFQHLPTVILILYALVIIVVYMKPGQQQAAYGY